MEAHLHTPVHNPEEYQEFKDVFHKVKASSLPPHCPLAINTTLPDIPYEQKGMEEYVQEAFEGGYIVPSTSTASEAFFFVEKKGDGLPPYIDYTGWIQIKYPYPLPLVPSTLEQLHLALIFLKLDLHSTYNLIHICEGVEVDEW